MLSVNNIKCLCFEYFVDLVWLHELRLNILTCSNVKSILIMNYETLGNSFVFEQYIFICAPSHFLQAFGRKTGNSPVAKDRRKWNKTCSVGPKTINSVRKFEQSKCLKQKDWWSELWLLAQHIEKSTGSTAIFCVQWKSETAKTATKTAKKKKKIRL